MSRKKLLLIIIVAVLIAYVVRVFPIGCQHEETIVTYASFISPPPGKISGVAVNTFSSVIVYYSTNFYYTLSGKTLLVYLPTPYVKIAKNMSYMLDDLDAYTHFSIAGKYFALGMPALPNSEDYLMFSSKVAATFKYGNQDFFAPMDVLFEYKTGICQNYAKLWAAVALAEGKTVTVYFLLPYNDGVGHVFVVLDNGIVIENNGHVYLNLSAALNNWYYNLGPYSIIELTMYPGEISFNLSTSSFTTPIMQMKPEYNYTATVTLTSKNRVITYTVVRNPFTEKAIICKKTYSIVSKSNLYFFVTQLFGKTIPVFALGFEPVILPSQNFQNALIYFTENNGTTTAIYGYINADTTFVYTGVFGRKFTGVATLIVSSTPYLETVEGVFS